MLKKLSLLLLLAAPWPCAAAGPQVYAVRDCFTVNVPAGWRREGEPYGLTDQEKKVYGADFIAPRGGEFPVRISVSYYAPGNLQHPTHEKYIRQHSTPPLGANLDGKVYGKVADGRAGNYYAKVFERKTFEYFPPRTLKAKKVFIYEKFYVVPVKKGFFVLRYSAPADVARANRTAYEAAVASFRPLLR
ncbi:MAG: hypothetical protein A2X32_11500 [Elusimicrobia bacterium GWC2_64_44]|nr:MAG: hypothetical protein A2X32_11500 [Elusimicrobia bacterium GWC2_64_44]